MAPKAASEVQELMEELAFLHEDKFIQNKNDSYAIYQLKAQPEYHELRFASMDELARDLEYLRNKVQFFVEATEGTSFTDKAAIEKLLKLNGFSIVPSDSPETITVINHTHQEAILHLINSDEGCGIADFDMRSAEQSVRKDFYSMVYTGSLPDTSLQTVPEILDDLYMRFNLDHPEDFKGHSLSVSDVVVLKQNGQVNSYYTDSFGFKELPSFFEADNPLKNVEMSIEDDYGMIDGIINNGRRDEKEVKISDLSESAPKPKRKDDPVR